MRKPEVVLLSFLFLIWYVPEVDAQTTCTGTGPCSCTMSDGSGVIDVASLSKSDGTAAFSDVYAADGYFYSYNPCVGFNEGSSCTGVAGCQISGDQSTQYTVGDVNSAAFTYDGSNAHLTYSHSDDTGFQRKFDVTLQCDQSADPATFVASGESSPGSGQYSATLTTKCACPNVCSGTPPPQPTPKPGPGKSGGEGGGLTVGSILCIVFFALVFVYIVGGIVVQVGVRKASGKEMIPNSNFWTALPGYIKGGFMFTFGRFCRRSGYEKK